jgi:high-affinity nickel permease
MSRRNTLFNDVMRMPWPVGVVLAFLAFIGQQIALSMEIQSPIGHAFKTPVRVLGYFLIAMFLLASFVSFFNQVIRARPILT